MIIGIPQSALLRPRNWCPERGQEHYILGVLLEDVLHSLLYESRHGGRKDEAKRRSKGKGNMSWTAATVYRRGVKRTAAVRRLEMDP
jgi:hypothetical protein